MADLISLDVAGGDSEKRERRDSVANHQHILDVAQTLFREHDPASINMSDIVQAAGIGRGTLYRHFSNKADLCFALMDTRLAQFQDEVLEQLRGLTAVSASPLDKLDTFLEQWVLFTEREIRLLIEIQKNNPDYFAESSSSSPLFWAWATVNGLLETAVSQRLLPANTDTDYLSDALLAPLNARLYDQQRSKGFSPKRISDGIRFILRQLAQSS